MARDILIIIAAAVFVYSSVSIMQRNMYADAVKQEIKRGWKPLELR